MAVWCGEWENGERRRRKKRQLMQEVDGDHQRDATDRSIQGRNGAHCGHHYHGKGENHCVRQNNVSIVDFWQNRIRTKKFFSAFFLCRVKRVRQVRRRRGQSCIVGGETFFMPSYPLTPPFPSPLLFPLIFGRCLWGIQATPATAMPNVAAKEFSTFAWFLIVKEARRRELQNANVGTYRMFKQWKKD